MTFCCKDIGIRQSEFVAKTQFLWYYYVLNKDKYATSCPEDKCHALHCFHTKTSFNFARILLISNLLPPHLSNRIRINNIKHLLLRDSNTL